MYIHDDEVNKLSPADLLAAVSSLRFGEISSPLVATIFIAVSFSCVILEEEIV